MVCAITYFIVNTSLVVGAIAVTVVGLAGAGLEPGVPAQRAGLPGRGRWSPAWSRSPSPTASFVLLPIVASPLYVCYRGYHRRWTEMATALLNRAAASAGASHRVTPSPGGRPTGRPSLTRDASRTREIAHSSPAARDHSLDGASFP